MDQPSQPTQSGIAPTLSGKTVPICRLVLPTRAGFDLAAKLNAFVAALEKQGVIKKVMTAPGSPADSKPN
jgi:hypothetical protein